MTYKSVKLLYFFNHISVVYTILLLEKDPFIILIMVEGGEGYISFVDCVISGFYCVCMLTCDYMTSMSYISFYKTCFHPPKNLQKKGELLVK